MINEEAVKKSLRKVIEHKSGKDVVDLGMISSIIVKGGSVGFALEFTGDAQAREELRKNCEKAVEDIPGVTRVTVVATSKKQSAQQKAKLDIEGVKNIIIVASGKGGVGKSTIALNLALSLSKLKHRVALADADIYGPSIPKMLGTEDLKPEIRNSKIVPIEKYGLHTISIGYLIDKDRAAIWRGPMITKALYNLLMGTKWSDIEYLIIDTPPGTGDVHLSLMENFNLTGAIIVSTPQELALIDARKIYDMFIKLDVPIIGIIENMSYFIHNRPLAEPVYDEKFLGESQMSTAEYSNVFEERNQVSTTKLPPATELCKRSNNSKTYIFGKEGVKKMSKELGIKLLGEIPIDPQICKASECGNPLELSESLAEIYENIAKIVAKPRSCTA